MSEFFKFLNIKLKSLVEISTNFFKISLFLGILIALDHFRKINYLPKDLSIGDGFLFILISCKFALIYIFFLGSCFIGGRIIFIIINFIKSLYSEKFHFLDRIISKTIITLTMDVLTFDFYEKLMISIAILFALAFSILFYFIFWETSIFGFFLFILCGIFSSGFIYIFQKTKKRTDIPDNDKHIQMVMALIFMTIIPFIIYSHFTSSQKLTNFATSSLQENDKNAIFYVKKEQIDLLPSEIIVDSDSDNYVKLKDSKILLRGFGRNALVEYEFKNKGQLIKDKVEIPNEAIQIKWQ